MRRIALKHKTLGLTDLQRLLNSRIHEYRAATLEILAAQYAKDNERQRNDIVVFYLRNTGRINNWDLVDASARPILGEHLKTHPRKILKKLAKSANLWECRISIVSTMTLVWAGELEDALEIPEILLDDTHDLIHKGHGMGTTRGRRRGSEQANGFSRKTLCSDVPDYSTLSYRALCSRAAEETAGWIIRWSALTLYAAAFSLL